MPVPSAVPEQDVVVAPPTGGGEKPQEKIDDVSKKLGAWGCAINLIAVCFINFFVSLGHEL